MGRQKQLPHKWVGKKNEGLLNKSIFFLANVQIRRIWTFGTFFLPSFPIPKDVFPEPFMARRKTRESEGRPSPQIPKESEGTRNQRLRGPLRFLWNLRGRPFLRFRYFFLFLVLFLSEKGRVFPELRRSRGKYRKRKKFALFPCVFLSDQRSVKKSQKGARNRKEGQKIFAINGSGKKALRKRVKEKRDRGPRGRFSTGDERFLPFFGRKRSKKKISDLSFPGRKKRSEIFFPSRNCMQFSRDRLKNF